MRDCILSILWPREDIYKFFSDHGCSKTDLKVIENPAEKQLSRLRIVNTMFDRLSAKPDGGLGPFRAMLQSLTTWSHFDPYYFGKLKKLDRSQAESNLSHLRQLQEIRDAKIKSEREARSTEEARAQKTKASLISIKKEFLDLHSGKLKPQQRGYALERILADLAKLCRLEVTESFRVAGEQVDGAIKFDGEHYLLEAKWQETAASNEPVYQFVGKVEGKMYGRGLFVSVHGFSEYVVKSVVTGKALRTVFVDGEDLVLVIEEQLSFAEMVDKKVKAAQTKGLIYVNPISGKSKIQGD